MGDIGEAGLQMAVAFGVMGAIGGAVDAVKDPIAARGLRNNVCNLSSSIDAAYSSFKTITKTQGQILDGLTETFKSNLNDIAAYTLGCSVNRTRYKSELKKINLYGAIGIGVFIFILIIKSMFEPG